jgi:hypothetical protein
LPNTCAANFDNLQTVPKSNIGARIARLTSRKMKEAGQVSDLEPIEPPTRGFSEISQLRAVLVDRSGQLPPELPRHENSAERRYVPCVRVRIQKDGQMRSGNKTFGFPCREGDSTP